MALAQGIAWEARADGNAANGGGFKIGASGTDRCQQAAQHATLTTASVVHSTTTQLNVDAGDYTVSATDVGNVVFVTGGSATPGRYEITVADVGNNRWTVDRALGTAGQTCPGRMGGAVASPHTITNGIWVAGNTMWIRGDAGTITHTATWLSGNPAATWSTSARGNRIIGYDITRGDTPTGTDRPLIELSTNTGLIGLQIQGDMNVENLRFDGADLGTSVGLFVGAGCRIGNCYFTRMQSYGIDGRNARGVFLDCEATDMGASATTGIHVGIGAAFGCWSHDNPCTGFLVSLLGAMSRCVATKNRGAGADGILPAANTTIEHCTVHGNGRDGIRYSGSESNRLLRGNLITDNGQDAAGYGINFPTGLMVKSPWTDYNGFWSNATDETNGISDTGGSHTSGDYTLHNVTLGGDPYKDASTDDYRLNETDGADLWGMSPYEFVDIGAFQHDPDDEPVVGGDGVMGARIQTGY